MPYAVESSDNSCLRSHESIAHPYGKYSILLSQCLTGRNFRVILQTHTTPYRRLMIIGPSYRPSDGKLESTAEERNAGHRYQHPAAQRSMHDMPHGNRDRKSQSKCPYIERQVRVPHEPPVKSRCQIPHKPCCKARHYKQRQDLGQNHAERSPEFHAGIRLDQRHNQRNQQGSKNIDKNHICCNSRHITSKFTSHYCRSRCCRTNET